MSDFNKFTSLYTIHFAWKKQHLQHSSKICLFYNLNQQEFFSNFIVNRKKKKKKKKGALKSLQYTAESNKIYFSKTDNRTQRYLIIYSISGLHFFYFPPQAKPFKNLCCRYWLLYFIIIKVLIR